MEKEKSESFIQNGTLFIDGKEIYSSPVNEKIFVGKHELKVETLEKLIDFAESGKLDEITEQGA